MTYYSDYVSHMLRFYLRYPKPDEHDQHIDHVNWLATDKVFTNLPEREQEFIRILYGEKRAGKLDVASIAYNAGYPLGEAWDIIKRTHAKIARVRGLI